MITAQKQIGVLIVNFILRISSRCLLLSILFCNSTFQSAISQPALEFVRHFDAGQSGLDGFKDIYALPNDGLVMCGHAAGLIGNIWVVEIDVEGEIV